MNMGQRVKIDCSSGCIKLFHGAQWSEQFLDKLGASAVNIKCMGVLQTFRVSKWKQILTTICHFLP